MKAYLDHNATSPWSPSVEGLLKKAANDQWGWWNPDSVHAFGQLGADELKACRDRIKRSLQLDSGILLFTGGATESINQVLSLGSCSRLQIKKVLAPETEHSATLNCLKSLRGNVEVELLKVDPSGRVCLEDLKDSISDGVPSLLSVSWVNSETGVIEDIEGLREVARQHHCFVHVDAAQALGKLTLDFSRLDVDFISMSGHKIGALKGVGALWASESALVSPLIHGGSQGRGLRAGTVNLLAIKSFQLALEDQSEAINLAIAQLRDQLEKSLLSLNNSFRVVGGSAPRVGNTTNICFTDFPGLALLTSLSASGIYVSQGSACTAGSVEPSHVLLAMGLSKTDARSCLRFSLGPSTTAEQILYVREIIGQVLDRLK